MDFRLRSKRPTLFRKVAPQPTYSDILPAPAFSGMMVSPANRGRPKTVGDCPNFAESSEQNGTVPLSETVSGLGHATHP